MEIWKLVSPTLRIISSQSRLSRNADGLTDVVVDRFMLFEIIKHAAHATVDFHGVEKAKDHPIRVTVVYGSKDLAVRVTDEGIALPESLRTKAEFVRTQEEDCCPGAG